MVGSLLIGASLLSEGDRAGAGAESFGVESARTRAAGRGATGGGSAARSGWLAATIGTGLRTWTFVGGCGARVDATGGRSNATPGEAGGPSCPLGVDSGSGAGDKNG